MTPPIDVSALRHEVAAARARLIASLEGASEADFGAELEAGTTVVSALARLARTERAAVEEARRRAGLDARPTPAVHGEPARRLTPPPVMHDLAGAHHEVLLLIDALAALDKPGVAQESAGDALLALAEAEAQLAARIALRLPRNDPPRPVSDEV